MLISSKLLAPAMALLFTAAASADVNLFNYSKIDIVPPSNGAIGAFSDTCPPYPSCNVTVNTGYFPDGFPGENMFGKHEQTAEGTYDTIFNGTSSSGGQTYDNVYFTMKDGNPISHIGNIFVDGSQDGTSSNRSFYQFLLWTYTDVNVLSTYHLLYSATPTLDPTTGYEHLSGYVGANNVGPNFVAQFLTTSPSGVRVFDVSATVPEPAGFLVTLPLLALAGCIFFTRRRRCA